MIDQTAFDETRRKAHGMSERAWAVYVDQARPTDETVAEVIQISIAEELRQMAASLNEVRAELDPRSLRYGALGHAIDELLARADYLDPDGAA